MSTFIVRVPFRVLMICNLLECPVHIRDGAAW